MIEGSLCTQKRAAGKSRVGEVSHFESIAQNLEFRFQEGFEVVEDEAIVFDVGMIEFRACLYSFSFFSCYCSAAAGTTWARASDITAAAVSISLS